MQTKTDKCNCQVQREEEEKKEALSTPLFFKATHLTMLLHAIEDSMHDDHLNAPKTINMVKDAQRICKNIYKQSCVIHNINPHE